MKLILFDIDGTILDSVKTDDLCYIKTFWDLFSWDLSNIDWNNFKNVTDSGITQELFFSKYERAPTGHEIESIISYYGQQLEFHSEFIKEIDCALSFLEHLDALPDIAVGFATGGWRETAVIKCKSIGFKLEEHPFVSSSDHFERASIIDLAIKDALVRSKVESFDSITYFGDGLWDLRATKEMGIDFIGVDHHSDEKLRNAGVKRIISDYKKQDEILEWIL